MSSGTRRSGASERTRPTEAMQRFIMTVLVLAVPRVVLACPVCFGQSDSPMAWGSKMGVFFMLGVTVFMLAAFAGFFIYLIRRQRTV